MNTHLPFVKNALQAFWGIDALLTPLDGELDFNLSARSDDGQLYLVKLMRVGCDPAFVDMQCKALAHIERSDCHVTVSRVVPATSGQLSVAIPDQSGAQRLMWVLSFIEGTLYSQFSPCSEAVNEALGEQLGELHRALTGFEHPQLHRQFNWNLMQSGWIAEHLQRFDKNGRKEILSTILDDYRNIRSQLEQMPVVAIHNDVNDNNIVVQQTLGKLPEIAGIIDFGDLCAAPRICDVAIAGAYVVLDHDEPGKQLAALIKGFHSRQALTEEELGLLIPLLRLRLAVSVVTSTLLSDERPDDLYLVVSQAPAWKFLESSLETQWLLERSRIACGFAVVPEAEKVQSFLNAQRGQMYPMFNRSLDDASSVSLSVESATVPHNPFVLTNCEALALGEGRLAVGGYAEPRLIYTDKAFQKNAYKASERRTVHLGVDVFAPAGTEVLCALCGIVAAIENRTVHLDYGGLVVLEHQTDEGDSFFSLYGHLDPESCKHLSLGLKVDAGALIAELGSPACNGGWAPHLHLQLALRVSGMGDDWPGVAYPDDKELWCQLCPNPAALLNLPDERTAHEPISESIVLAERQENFAPNLSLSYREPLLLLRGYRHHLFDQWGRAYLDAYNNVPHVGHAHQAIKRVVARQLDRLNSNTRYLHPAQTEFAKAVLATMPDQLTVCYLVNSGSEANELALRLARAATGGKDMITPDHGYHGNTTGAVDISAYKFNAPGGVGQPDWVQLVDIPDDYRGRFRRGECDSASCYAEQVDKALDRIVHRGGKLAGFIAETFPSVGGQIVPPDGYLGFVYEKVRAAGGICIADEVQTGLGRLGEYFYGIEQQAVVPDIVVLGKPIGNGHPLGVVVTTNDIASSFALGPEFFSTFGGSTLSCMVGKAVLDTVKEDGLQENARVMGSRLMAGLTELQRRHEMIGDVRGMGLFIGVDLVIDRQSRRPATANAAHVVNRLRDKRILTGLEGPDNNVLKIRPPLTIDVDDVDMIVETLDSILAESVFLQ